MANCPPGFKLPCGVASRTVGSDWQSGFGRVGPRVNPVRVVNRRFPVLEPGCPAGRVAAVSPSGGRGCCPPGAMLIDTPAGVRCVWPIPPSTVPPGEDDDDGRDDGGGGRDDGGGGGRDDQNLPCPEGQFRKAPGLPCVPFPCPDGYVSCGEGAQQTCCPEGQCGANGCEIPCPHELQRTCWWFKPIYNTVTGEFEYLQSKKTPGCTSATAQGFYDAGYYGVQFCACGGNPSEGASCGDGPIVIKKPPNAI